jgi:hypothetical protein
VVLARASAIVWGGVNVPVVASAMSNSLNSRLLVAVVWPVSPLCALSVQAEWEWGLT